MKRRSQQGRVRSRGTYSRKIKSGQMMYGPVKHVYGHLGNTGYTVPRPTHLGK